MTADDLPPAEPDSESDDSASHPPVPLSVDRLTQAFAHLMGDDVQDDEAPGPVDGTPEADAPAEEAEQTCSDVELDEDDNVTPSTILEALLFVGHPQNEPLTARQMASYLRGVSPQEVDQLIEGLNEQYSEDHSAYRIASVGAGYRMELQEEFLRLRECFYGRVREAKLSQSAVDLIAIVAYHQPIARNDIDRFRGQPCGGTLSQLVRRQLLQVEYTPEKPRKKVYRTTDRFLNLFGLESLEDLPSHEDF